MTTSEIIRKIVSEIIGVPLKEVADNSHLFADLNAQSLEIADLISALEQKFVIEIPQEAVDKFTTVGDIIIYIADHTDSFDE